MGWLDELLRVRDPALARLQARRVNSVPSPPWYAQALGIEDAFADAYPMMPPLAGGLDRNAQMLNAFADAPQQQDLRANIITDAAARDAEYQRSGYDASAGFGPGQRREDLWHDTLRRLGEPFGMSSTDDFGASDLAMGFSGGGLTLAGEKAVGAPLGMLEKAKAAAAKGHAPDDVWRDTGWMKGPDGKWRWEIDDSGSRLTPKVEGRLEERTQAFGPMEEILDHPQLYEAYPQLRQHDTVASHGPYGGSYTPELISASGNMPGAVRSVLLHEGQHGVQEIEDFARGADTRTHFLYSAPEVQSIRENKAALESYLEEQTQQYRLTPTPAGRAELKKIEDTIHQLEVQEERAAGMAGYQRNAGEVEARDVEARAGFSADERRWIPPYRSQGIPFEDMIVRHGGGGGAQMSAPLAVPLTKWSRAGQEVPALQDASAGELSRFMGRFARENPHADANHVRGLLDTETGVATFWPGYSATHSEMVPALREMGAMSPKPSFSLRPSSAWKSFELYNKDGKWVRAEDPMSQRVSSKAIDNLVGSPAHRNSGDLLASVGMGGAGLLAALGPEMYYRLNGAPLKQ